MAKQTITDQSPGGGTRKIEVDVPTWKPGPDPTYDGVKTKDYAPDPSRKNRTSFGVGEGDQQ